MREPAAGAAVMAYQYRCKRILEDKHSLALLTTQFAPRLKKLNPQAIAEANCITDVSSIHTIAIYWFPYLTAASIRLVLL